LEIEWEIENSMVEFPKKFLGGADANKIYIAYHRTLFFFQISAQVADGVMQQPHHLQYIEYHRLQIKG
jgi:hypothetical protein